MTQRRAAVSLPLLVLLFVFLLVGAVAGVATLGSAASDGAVLRTIPLGSAPDAILVDATAGRAFVTTRGDAGVRVIDTRSGRLVRTVAVGTSPLLAAVDQRR